MASDENPRRAVVAKLFADYGFLLNDVPYPRPEEAEEPLGTEDEVPEMPDPWQEK